MKLGRGHRLSLEDGLSRLPTPAEGPARGEGQRFVTLFEHGTLQVEVYAPRGHDPQQPHDRDEVYVVAGGSGVFFCDGHRAAFGSGDFLFVPAGVEHRFEDFSDDLAVWVLFYGPVGGEAAGTAESA